MAVPAGAISAAGEPSGSGADWEAVRALPDIQFAPVEIPPRAEPETPAWVKALGDFLSDLLGPVGEALAQAWPVLKWILLGLAVLFALALLWRLIEPVARMRRAASAAQPEWSPNRAQALALLEEADRLAAEGRFDEATHLLLRRSIGQIAAARPEWLDPSSTAREIAGLPALPERARRAFATIAERVERSLFALRSLGLDDWQAARTAYADFALTDLAPGRAG